MPNILCLCSLRAEKVQIAILKYFCTQTRFQPLSIQPSVLTSNRHFESKRLNNARCVKEKMLSWLEVSRSSLADGKNIKIFLNQGAFIKTATHDVHVGKENNITAANVIPFV